MRRALVLAPLVIACSVRSGCESASVQRSVGDVSVEITAHGVKSYAVGGVGIPHVGGILWPEFDGYGIELRLRVDGRPPVSVTRPAPDPAAAPEEDALKLAAEAVEISASPGGEHLAFRNGATGGWTIVHLLPEGVPFRSQHSDSMAEAATLEWSSLPSPESIALEALRSAKPDRSVLAAVEAQTAREPWNAVLLEVWQPGTAVHDVFVARLEADDEIDPAFIDQAAEAALRHVDGGGKRLRPAIDLLLALKDESWIAEMDERLLRALPDKDAQAVLKRRVAPVPTIGRKYPPSDDLKRRARAALDP
jgi:hypothetical protein